MSIKKIKRRHRYIGFSVQPVHPADFFTYYEVAAALESSYRQHIHSQGIKLIHYTKNSGVLRCDHLESDQVKKLLTTIHTLRSHEVHVKSIVTSGTLHGIRKTIPMNQKNRKKRVRST